MSAAANPVSLASEVSTAHLLVTLSAHGAKALVFHYDGRDVKPSYHVTEVKSGRFHGLDCGANPESWDETFIQLWDIVEESRGYMPVGKFLAIMRKVTDVVPFHHEAKLTFEVSDGVVPMQLYKADRIAVDDFTVRVHLNPRPSSCKPRDRWLVQESSCCAPKAEQPCCG